MPKPNEPAPFAFEGLDRAIHEKARLGILTSLLAHPKGLAFGDLSKLCNLTAGNLSRHLQVLQETDLVAIEKSFDRNRPLTTCKLTRAGRERFVEYLEVLEGIVRDASALTANPKAARGARLKPI